MSTFLQASGPASPPGSLLLHPPRPIIGALRVAGPDAAAFLQGQWTQDIRKVAGGTGARGLWLDRKGRVQGESWIFSDDGGSFRLLSESLSSAQLRSRLEAFLVADEVEVFDAAIPAWQRRLNGASATVARALGFSGLPEGLGSVERSPLGLLLADEAPWGGPSHRLLLAEPPPSTWPGFAGAQLSELEVELRRLRSGLPLVGLDVGPSDLPGEAGLDDGWVCYTKGCFLGQEVLARIRAQGMLRRGLARLEGSAPPPPAPCELFAGDRKVGELRSACATSGGWIGLGLVQLAAEGPFSYAPGQPPVVRRCPG